MDTSHEYKKNVKERTKSNCEHLKPFTIDLKQLEIMEDLRN